MPCTITPAQHVNLTARGLAAGRDMFGKHAETQTAAVKRLMARHRRAWKYSEPRAFPRFKPGMSTAEYVALFEAMNSQRAAGAGYFAPLNTAPATLYEGDAFDFDVICEPL